MADGVSSGRMMKVEIETLICGRDIESMMYET